MPPALCAARRLLLKGNSFGQQLDRKYQENLLFLNNNQNIYDDNIVVHSKQKRYWDMANYFVVTHHEMQVIF